MTTHLLAIGVNQSLRDRSIRPLQFAVADAQEFSRFCAEELGWGQHARLLADAPSFYTVRNALDEIGRQVAAGDTFVLYFSGHGYVVNDEPYCLLSQAELRPLEQGRTDSNDLLSVSWLRREVHDTWPRGVHLACILDACRTEIRDGTKGGGTMSEFRQRLQGYNSRDIGLHRRSAQHAAETDLADDDVGDIELYACTQGEQSLEFAPIGRGLFSFALQGWLREGIARGEPRVIDERLAQVLHLGVDTVVREHRKASPGQRPVVKRNGAPVLLFDPLRGGAGRPLTRSQQEALDQFEAHLVAGRLDDPFQNCARDTLIRLENQVLPLAQLQGLFERLQAAREQARADADARHDEQLLVQAMQMNCVMAWTTVVFQARLPATREQANRRLAELQMPPPASPEPPAPPPPDPAEVAWRTLGAEPDAAACRVYLARYVGSAWAHAARERLAALDSAAWALALSRRTEAGFLAYLADWAEGEHAPDAERAIEGLRADEARQVREAQEDADWSKAQQIDTSAGYRRFVDQWPKGRHLDQALSKWGATRVAEQEQADLAAARQAGKSEEHAEVSSGAPMANGPMAHPNVLARVPWRRVGWVLLMLLVAREWWVSGSASQGATAVGSVSASSAAFVEFRAMEALLQVNGCDDCGQLSVIGAAPDHKAPKDAELRRELIEPPAPVVGLGGFQMGRTEVTQGQWKAVMGSNPSHFKSCGNACPVENISWDDIAGADGFLSRLNRQLGLTGRRAYRLPTETEWGLATKASFWGRVAGSGAGQRDSVHQTARADSNERSSSGLYNIQGNVREWMQDCWSATYSEVEQSRLDNKSPRCTTTNRVVRGGSWSDSPENQRPDIRSSFASGERNYITGFRLARDN